MFCILKSRFRQRPMQIVCQSCQHTTTDVAQVHAHRSHIHRPYGPNICHVMPPHVTALAITFCEMAHFGVRFGPFRTAKRPILQAKTARFATHCVSIYYTIAYKTAHQGADCRPRPCPTGSRAAPTAKPHRAPSDGSQRTARRQPVYRQASVRALSLCKPYVAFSAKMPRRADKCTTNLARRPFFSNQKS